MDRRLKQDSLLVELPTGNVTIDILVENMGRINFGPNLLKNEKGITNRVTFNGQELHNWQMYSLPFDHIGNISFNKPYQSKQAPILKKAVFELTKTGDTYLDMRLWGKGAVWVNGHHLGRYWAIGPQQTIYVPAEWLRKGKNEIVVLELLTTGQNSLQSLHKPVLDVLAEKK